MGKFKYTSLEDGQVVESDEPRADLDELARWVRSDGGPTEEPQERLVVTTTITGAAGPLNTDPSSGSVDGAPAVVSASAGIANPADTLTPEQAEEQAREQLNGGVPPLSEQPGPGDVRTGAETEEPVVPRGSLTRPGLNGSTEDWLAYVRQPELGVEVADDAGRGDIITAYLDKFQPKGNASADAWSDWAREHSVDTDGDRRGEIRTAVVDAGWAKA